MSKDIKKMRKPYAKPAIAIENFTLNQFIASCTIKTRNNNNWKEDLLEYSPYFHNLIEATKQFAAALDCEVDADEHMDTLCYHTSTSPLFTS